MAKLRAALLAEFARVQNNVLHVIGGGIDTVTVSEIPAAANFSAAIVATFTRNECGRPHRIDLILQDEDGDRLQQVNATTTPEWNDAVPASWVQQTMIALNFGVVFPGLGAYSLEVLIDDRQEESLQIRVLDGSST